MTLSFCTRVGRGRGLEVGVKYMGQVNMVGPTLIEGSFLQFITCLVRQEEVETEGDEDGTDGDRGVRGLLAAVLAVPGHHALC